MIGDGKRKRAAKQTATKLDAEAVLADGGATANAQFIDGIVVVITPSSGAMAQAAIGGQQITYVPK